MPSLHTAIFQALRLSRKPSVGSAKADDMPKTTEELLVASVARDTPATPRGEEVNVLRPIFTDKVTEVAEEAIAKESPDRHWGAIIIFGIVMAVVLVFFFAILPAIHTNSVDTELKDGSWQIVNVVPLSFMEEGTTSSSSSSSLENSSWASKCYIYDCGNNLVLASQAPLEIGKSYNIKVQVHKWADGKTWLIEEARR